MLEFLEVRRILEPAATRPGRDPESAGDRTGLGKVLEAVSMDALVDSPRPGMAEDHQALRLVVTRNDKSGTSGDGIAVLAGTVLACS